MLALGFGFDAHKLVAGRPLILAGVSIPFSRGLEGHSDADVIIHALMDAFLGAVGERDIGELFPDNDPQFSGVSSMTLLETVAARISEHHYLVNNLDITVIAEKPRISTYVYEMRSNLSGALAVPVEKISIKATTTEGLGFTGREEGIAAMAAVLLVKKMVG